MVKKHIYVLVRILIVSLLPLLFLVKIKIDSTQNKPIIQSSSNTTYLAPSDFQTFVTDIFNIKPEQLKYNFCLINNNITDLVLKIPNPDAPEKYTTIDNKNLEKKYPEFGSMDANFYFSNNKQKNLHSEIDKADCLVATGADLSTASGTITTHTMSLYLSSSTLSYKTSILNLPTTSSSSVNTSKSVLRSSLTTTSLIYLLLILITVWSGFVILVLETFKFIKNGTENF